MMPIMKRELKLLAKERSFMLLVVIELLLLVSSNLFGIGYLLIANPQSSEAADFSPLVSIAVVTDTPYPFQKVMRRTNAVMVFYDDFYRAHDDFMGGGMDAIIVGSVDISHGRSSLDIHIPENSPKANLIKITAKDITEKLEEIVRRDRIAGLAPEIKSMNINDNVPFSPSSEIYFIFTLPLLLFLPSLISGSLVIDNITEEIEKKTLINLKRAPLGNWDIVFGKLAAVVAVAMLQCFAWLAIIGTTQVRIENAFWVVALFSLYAIVFSCIGAILALKLKSQRVSQIAFTMVSLGGLVFFSPIINGHPILVANSPAYLITSLVTGASAIRLMPQLLAIASLAALLVLAAYRLSSELEKI